MSVSFLLLLLLTLSLLGFWYGRRRALKLADWHPRRLHSLPGYYGYYAAIWIGLPALAVLGLWSFVEADLITGIVTKGLPEAQRSLAPERLGLLLNDIKNLATGNISTSGDDPVVRAAADHYLSLLQWSGYVKTGLVLVLAALGGGWALSRIHARQRTRNWVEGVLRWALIACSAIAILTTIGIVLSVLFESLRFFQIIPLTDFLFGLQWSPQVAIRPDQVGASGAFGFLPLLVGTLLITFIAMTVAVPIGLLSAIYLSEYAGSRLRAWAKPILEILAGIPTVVYGFFAALVVAPAIRQAGFSLGLDVASESALAAGLVMGIMIIPFVSSLSDDVINAVPQSLRDGSLALGATQGETVALVILPAALPGIVGAVLLAVSRAIGETMIVVMAAGLTANLTANPLDSVTTITVQIVTLLVGDQEFDSPKTLAAFALGLTLFVVTLALNVLALKVVRKYREQYD